MTDDELVSRLRATVMIDPSSGLEAQINPDGPEAAARLEALAAEKARLEGALRPFAEIAEQIADIERQVGDKPSPDHMLRLVPTRNLRNASAALAPSGISEGEG
jgi:hypothetical protein